MKRWQSIHSWPKWAWVLTGVLLVGAVVVAVLTWRGDDGGTTASPGTTTTPPATATTATSPPTTTTTTATTTAARTTTTRRTTTKPPAPGPGAVVAVAKIGGGSGEIEVDWNAVPGATGYRVLRTNPDGSRPRTVADFNITTGRTTHAAEVVNIWSAEHTYLPDMGPLTKVDQSPWFQYVDVGAPGERCYRVQAYNKAGSGPLSAITRATSPGDT